MDRSIVYTGAIPQDTDILAPQRATMVALGALMQAAFGAAPFVDGLVCTQTTIASMSVTVSQGWMTATAPVDATTFGSLGTDGATIVKMGVNETSTALGPMVAPSTAGQSVVYLVQAAFSEADAVPVVLPYVNAAVPASPYSGPLNTGVAQNTQRQQRVTLGLKVGVAATTGSQVAPAADSGYTALYTITIANGATTVVNANIAPAATAPFLRAKIPSILPPSSVLGGVSAVQVYAGNPNGHVAGNAATAAVPPDMVWDSTAGAFWVCTSSGTTSTAAWAAVAIAAHGSQQFTSSGTFTVPAGVTRIRVRAVGGGGGGAGCNTGVGAGGGGGAGGYGEGFYTVTPGATIAISIGAGGTAGIGTTGNSGGGGGNTVVTGLLTANGGAGGQLLNPTFAGGDGGTATGGTVINFTGADGGDGTATYTTIAGAGAAGPFGGGGRGGSGGGRPGRAPGSGGGGAYGSNSTGGAGGAGFVSVEW